MPVRSWLCPALLSATLLLAPSGVRADVEVDLELVLAVDVSGSIDPIEASLQRQGYVMALAHPRVVEAIENGAYGQIAIAYIEWANFQYQRMVVDWTLVTGADSAQTLAATVAEAPMVTAHWTSISGAIDYSASLFDGNGYHGLRRVIDISGDGYNNSGRPAAAARDDAVARDITINGLPIINDRTNPWGSPAARDLDVYYQDHVIGGPGAFMVVAETFDDFAAAILSKLILEIAGIEPDPPIVRPGTMFASGDR